MDDVTVRLRNAPTETEVGKGFSSSLANGVKDVDQEMKLHDQLVEGIVSGRVTEFHEVAAQVKQADLAFKFALSVRNKFVDAYREVMRMNV